MSAETHPNDDCTQSTPCESTQVNKSMRFLELEGNRIGRNGGQVSWLASAVSLVESSVNDNPVAYLALKIENFLLDSRSSPSPSSCRLLQALVLAMRTSVRSKGNLIVSVKNCDTSHHDPTLFDCANTTGKYTLDLQVSVPYSWSVHGIPSDADWTNDECVVGCTGRS